MTIQKTLDMLLTKNITGLFDHLVEAETEIDDVLWEREGIFLHKEDEDKEDHMLITMLGDVYWVCANNGAALPVQTYEQLESLILKVWEKRVS